MNKTILIAIMVAACDNDVDVESRRQFIHKASQALHPSAAPLSESEVDALVGKSDDEIIAELYAAPETRDAVFRLSLAFLGAPVDQLHQDGGWAAPPFSFAPAVTAARSFRDGGDPLVSLLTTRATQPRGVVQPVRQDYLDFYYPNLTVQGTLAERRALVTQAILGDVATMRSFVVALPEPFDTGAMCDRYENSLLFFIAFLIPEIIGVPAPVTSAGNPVELDDPAAFPLDYACFQLQPTTRAEALTRLDQTKVLFESMFARLEPILLAWETDSEGAFDPVDFEAIGFRSYYGEEIFGRSGFYPAFWQSAANSSTNYNRRRGAYVLDRYFCDDLKPVGAALPITHVEGRHASDPACVACHFKLDPMAGYFRRHGFSGTDFTDETLQLNGGQIIFDDGASVGYTQYESSWLAPAGSGRVFDVGYIRSTRDPKLNTYGSSLADLDQLLRTAPEVERCFVQRMFAHFNGTDQAVDPAFLDDVTADMRTAGADRLERGITRILTGATFRAPERNTNVCYDLAPGTSGVRPPCEVASILATHCTSCHGAGQVQANLDLTRWDRASDGGFGFTHSGVERLTTFERMLERVTTSDLARQMPQAKDMPLRQREQLALWLQAEIDEASR